MRKMTPTYMYFCKMFFLKTEGEDPKSFFGVPSNSLSQFNLKIQVAAEEREKWEIELLTCKDDMSRVCPMSIRVECYILTFSYLQ